MPRLIDDAELLRMAAEPPRDVAPVLRRAHWFTPLVALLAVAPAVVAVGQAALDEETACWGLRALAVRHSERLAEWLSPGSNGIEPSVSWAPPLAAWLTAPLLRLWPDGSSTPLLALSWASFVAAVVLTYLFADEAGGKRWAVLVTACLALHPQALRLVQTGAPDALCLALLAAAAWALWGHLRSAPGLVSNRLLIAGLAWGLLLLSGGPLALAFLAAVVGWQVWSLLSATEPALPSSEFSPSPGTRGRAAAFTIAVLVATGGALGSWWLAMMAAEHGWAFVSAWIIGQGGPDPLLWAAATPKASWNAWLGRSAFLGGWWVVGIVAAIRDSRSATPSAASQLARWLLVWLALSAAIRTALFWRGTTDPAVLRLWETFALLPATGLAAQGLDRALRRDVSWRLVLLALMVMIGHVCWLVTGRLSVGVIVGGSFGILVLASAPLALGLRRTNLAWTEAEIRNWVAVAVLCTLCGHAVLGWRATRPLSDRETWQLLLGRLRSVEDVSLASLVTSRGADSPQLRYLMRSLWPGALQTQSVGLDPVLAETMIREREAPRSRMVVVEWSRQGLLRPEVSSGWQISQMVEPLPYRGRRLAVHLLSPAPRERPP